ncbi:MAG: ATP-binding protein [Planctomycetota bacterium]|nr:ATP-binding protein [Planctomycetota bacterium]
MTNASDRELAHGGDYAAGDPSALQVLKNTWRNDEEGQFRILYAVFHQFSDPQAMPKVVYQTLHAAGFLSRNGCPDHGFRFDSLRQKRWLDTHWRRISNIFLRDDCDLLLDWLATYFVSIRPELNDDFLELLKAKTLEHPDLPAASARTDLIGQLRAHDMARDLALYEATLRCKNPLLFTEQPISSVASESYSQCEQPKPAISSDTMKDTSADSDQETPTVSDSDGDTPNDDFNYFHTLLEQWREAAEGLLSNNSSELEKTAREVERLTGAVEKEAQRLNNLLQSAVRAAGLADMTAWRGTEAWRSVWASIQAMERVRHEELYSRRIVWFEALARWLGEQPVAGVGVILRRRREKIVEALQELRKAATGDANLQFPGETEDTPLSWWAWWVEQAESEERLRSILAALREHWRMPNFAGVLEEGFVVPSDSVCVEPDLSPDVISVVTTASNPYAPVAYAEQEASSVSESKKVFSDAGLSTASKSEPRCTTEISIPTKISAEPPVPQAVKPQVTAAIARDNHACSVDADPPPTKPADEDNSSKQRTAGHEDDFAWRMMRNDRMDLAYYWTLCQEEAGKRPWPSASGLRALALANVTAPRDEKIAMEYEAVLHTATDFYVADIPEVTAEVRQAVSLAAGLIPLFSLKTPDARTLVDNSEGLGNPDGQQLIQIALDVANRNIDFTVLRQGILRRAEWQKRWDDFLLNLEQWQNSTMQASIIFDAATKVWREWLRPENDLGKLIACLGQLKPTEADKDNARRIVDNWSKDSFLKTQIHKTDAELRKGARLRPIDARAITGLRNHLKEPRAMYAQWLVLLSSEPEAISANFSKNITDFRHQIERHLPKFIDWLASRRTTADSFLAAAYAVAERSLLRLQYLFNPTDDMENVALPFTNVNLLRIPGLSLEGFDEGRLPPALSGVAAWSADFSTLLKAAGEDTADWETVAVRQEKAGNFINARAALRILHTQQPAYDLSARMAELDKRLSHRRIKCGVAMEQARNRLNRAYCDGLLTDRDMIDFDLPVVLETLEDFTALEARIRKMDARIDENRQMRVEKIRQDMDRNSQCTDVDRKLIERELEAGNLLVAEERAARLGENSQLTITAEGSEGEAFFPDFLAKIGSLIPEELTRRPLFEIARHLGPHLCRENDNRQHVDDDNKKDLQVIEDYHRLFKCRGADKRKHRAELVEKILTGLEFGKVRVQDSPGEELEKDVARFVIETTPLNRREICPIPFWGSEAGGIYNLLCLWNQPAEHVIRNKVNACNKGGKVHPTIVFYFGQMDLNRRRALAHENRRSNSRQSFLVVDNHLMLFLYGQRQRLAALFRSALPFTIAQPYSSTSGSGLPPEMFYGRAQQLESICYHDACLIYGGRQLGKTVLLRTAEREIHHPERDSIGLYLDLKHDGKTQFGSSRSPDQLWAVLADKLAEIKPGIMDPKTVKGSTFKENLKKWLNDRPEGRVVVFLDEADDFLHADRINDWRVVGEFKSIMNEMGKRFKVVFAGLHNVQRTAREANTPLAHFGDPICVGAFTGDETHEALRMVDTPLQALGYRFDNDSTRLTLLAHTNYYPSLIQILCKQLLENLQRNASFSTKDTPPYVITHAHVQDAYYKSRGDILTRFKWSLNLDWRYRFLALFIAFELLGDTSGRRCLSLNVIRNGALWWWPQGFSGQDSREDFHVLLDEMEGLGILAPENSEGYTLRNSNVLSLLGSAEEIEKQLEEVALRPGEVAYSPEQFRVKLSGGDRRSPLTEAQWLQLQESDYDVALVFGCQAAGIEHVTKALEFAPQVKVEVTPVEHFSRQESYEEWLMPRIRTAPSDTWLYLVIPHDCIWTREWVNFALKKYPGNHFGKNRQVKVVFLGDPAHAASWFESLPNPSPAIVRGERFKLLTLGPWHGNTVEQWLDSLQVADPGKHRQTLMLYSGGWGELLKSCKTSLDKEDTAAAWMAETSGNASSIWNKSFGLAGDRVELFRDIVELYQDFMDRVDERGYGETDIDLDELRGVVAEGTDSGHRFDLFWHWAEALGYVRPVSNSGGTQRWRINSIFRLLSPRAQV